LLRGFYTAASGMIAQQRRQEMVSNNIANVNTPGYKADQATLRSFPEMLIHLIDQKKIPTTNEVKLRRSQPIGGLHTGVYAQESILNFSQGMIRETGMFTDVALIDRDYPDENGQVFFTVRNENGDIRYTRNGNFTVDGEGYLTTNEGFYVLDENGNEIQTDGLEFLVTDEGYVQTAAGQARLGIAYIADAHELIKEENDLLSPEAGDVDVQNAYASDANFTMRQGFLEGSNVDAGRSMTEMMQAYRNFEMNQRVLKAYDESMDKAVNQIARLT